MLFSGDFRVAAELLGARATSSVDFQAARTSLDGSDEGGVRVIWGRDSPNFHTVPRQAGFEGAASPQRRDSFFGPSRGGSHRGPMQEGKCSVCLEFWSLGREGEDLNEDRDHIKGTKETEQGMST